MNELSLFSGAGGGLLGSILLGWRTVGAVEIDDYCCKVLEARQRDGCLEEFPIWNMDIREFNRRVAGSYAGMVDVISGGDPCQDNSAATVHRSKHPSLGGEFIEAIRIIRPTFVQRENPAKVRKDAPWPADRFISELSALGYTAIPLKLRSCCLGGKHERSRLYVHGALADAHGEPNQQAIEKIHTVRENRCPQGENDGVIPLRTQSSFNWMLSETDICREINAVASRVDRARAVANGQDPIVAATAWRLLTEGETSDQVDGL